MIRRLILLLTATLSMLLMAPSGCGPRPTPNPPPQPPASGGNLGYGGSSSSGGVAAGGSTTPTKCQLACSNLAALGCPEDQATCNQQCELLTHDDRFAFDRDCRINAKTKTAAQKCGPASCR